MAKKLRPFLKWAGGKYTSLDKLLPLFESYTHLIEPYVGSGVVFLNANVKKNLLCDINPDLINLYKTLKKQGKDFIDDAKKLFIPKYNCTEKYLQIRTKFNTSSDAYAKSLWFIYMNRHGYNGLCRYSKNGFNVPFGRYKKPYFPEEELYNFHHKSKTATFKCLSYTETFKLAKQGSLIYCDPPYAPLSETAQFTSYSHPNFSAEDQTKLAELAQQSGQRGITVIISNHDTKFTRFIYRGSTITSHEVKRYISCKANKRKAVRELIAVYNP